MRNRYAHGSKLDEETFTLLIRRFAEDRDASRIARELDLNRKTVNDYLRRVRVRLAAHCVLSALEERKPGAARSEVFFQAAPPEPLSGPVGGLACGLLSGILLPGATLHAEVAPGEDALALRTLLRGRLALRGWRRDREAGFAQALDLDFLEDESVPDAREREEMAAAELVARFLAYARSRLLKFRGVGADRLRLHLKESELRFNLGASAPEKLTRLTLGLLEARPLSDRRNRPAPE